MMISAKRKHYWVAMGLALLFMGSCKPTNRNIDQTETPPRPVNPPTTQYNSGNNSADWMQQTYSQPQTTQQPNNVGSYSQWQQQQQQQQYMNQMGQQQSPIIGLGSNLLNSFLNGGLQGFNQQPYQQPYQTPGYQYQQQQQQNYNQNYQQPYNNQQNTQPQQNLQNVTTAHQELLTQHNSIRQQNGLGQLTMNQELVNAATSHAQNLANGRYRSDGNGGSHTYGGTTFSQRARSAGYNASPRSENWAMGGSQVSSIMNMWMNSSGHRRNILLSDINEVGFGVVSESGGTIHYVTVFGRR